MRGRRVGERGEGAVHSFWRRSGAEMEAEELRLSELVLFNAGNRTEV